MMDSEYLAECVKNGPWWAESVVEALEALKIGDIESAIEALEYLLPQPMTMQEMVEAGWIDVDGNEL